MFEIDISENITILVVNVEDFSEDWNTKAPTITTKTIGDDFVNQNVKAQDIRYTKGTYRVL